MTAHSLFYTTFASQEEAKNIITKLLKNRLIACANLLQKSESFYWWEGKIESQEEWPALLKSESQHKSEIEDLIKKEHSYECPCFIEITMDQGSKDYLNWITKETKNESH